MKHPAIKRPVVKRPAVKRPAVKRLAVKRPLVKRPLVKRPAIKCPVTKYRTLLNTLYSNITRINRSNECRSKYPAAINQAAKCPAINYSGMN